MIQVTIEDTGRKHQMDAQMSAALLGFCLNRSDRVVLSRAHTEEIVSDVFEKLIADEAERILAERERELDFIESRTDRQLKKDGFLSREQAVELIHQQAESRIAALEETGSRLVCGRDTVEEDLAPYGLEKREISIGSFTEEAPWFDLCWFPKELSVLRVALEEDLFHCPVEIGSCELIDPCFADGNGRVWARISSLKRRVTLDLCDEDYRAFVSLGIPHRADPPQRTKKLSKKTVLIGAAVAVSVISAAFGITAVCKSRKEQKVQS